MAERLLKVDNLTKTFTTGFLRSGSETKAVNNISFELDFGHISGLIGESGSGKTTAAVLISKLLKPTGGKIYLKGKEIWSIPNIEYYKQVQLLFQDPYSSFNPVYRVKHGLTNVFKVLSRVPENEQEQKILEVLDLVRLTDEILDKFPHEISGGQLQRASLARALLINPDLLIVDEPTSMVDASLRVTILNILQSLARSLNKSILFITHDLSQAFYLCDEINIMCKGEIVEKGSAKEVILNPQHSYSKKLIADIPKLTERYETLRDDQIGNVIENI
ncbi:MAG: ATP-binding cassette domain-containing protein [Candidatus Bathyarchaeia archaeon]|jgi:peptide/nickel transport system ATP-binding protein